MQRHKQKMRSAERASAIDPEMTEKDLMLRRKFVRKKKWQKEKMKTKKKESQGRKRECRENEVKSHGEIE